MPRDTRNRRLTRPGTAAASAAKATGVAQRPLASLLAHTTGGELLPYLHQHALDVSGGSCSLLFQHNPRIGVLQATSAFALETLETDPWMPGADEADLVADAFARPKPLFVADAHRRTPDLASRLNTPSALLLPLTRNGERVGLVAIGVPGADAPSGETQELVEVADAFLTALELFRLRQ